MNKIIAFALLALCVSAAKVKFTPHKLPCEYTIVEEYNSTVKNEVRSLSNTIRVHGTFGMVTNEVKEPTAAFLEGLVRIDIADYQHDKIAIFRVDTTKSDKCSEDFQDRKSVLDAIDSTYLELFKKTTEFDSVSNGKFEGKDCKIYYRKVNDTDEYLFADKDNYILGHNATSGDQLQASRYKYDMKAPLDKFVIDGTKYPGCSQYASQPPVVDECTDIEFQAHKLPCEYTIKSHNDFIDPTTGTEYVVDDEINVHGDFKQNIVKQSTPITYEGHTLLRTDVNDSTSFTVFISDSRQKKCEDHVYTREIIEQRVNETLAIFQDKWIFHAKADGEFQGKPCTMYYTNTNGSEMIFFVDKDNYVIGLNRSNTETTQTASFSYSNEAPLHLFVIDKDLKGCSKPAYTKPAYSPCGDNESAASTVLVSFVLFVASIMFALF